MLDDLLIDHNIQAAVLEVTKLVSTVQMGEFVKVMFIEIRSDFN